MATLVNLVSMVVKEEKKDMMDCSEKYILEYGDSKLKIPNEVGPTEDGKSLKVDLKDDEDIKKFVGNCQGSEGTYLDQAQEDKEMDESPIKQKLISLKEKPRIPLDCVDAIASASDIIPIRSSADGDVDNKQENGSFGVKQGTGTTVELLSDDDGDLYSSEEEEPNLEEGHLNSNTEVDNKREIENSTPLDPSLKSALLKEDSGAAPNVSQEQDGKWYIPAAGKLIIFLVVCSKIFPVFAIPLNQCIPQQPVQDYKLLTDDAVCQEPNHPVCEDGFIFICAFHVNKSLGSGCVESFCVHGKNCPHFTQRKVRNGDKEETVIEEGKSCSSCNGSFNIPDWRKYTECYELTTITIDTPTTTWTLTATGSVNTSGSNDTSNKQETSREYSMIVAVVMGITLPIVTILILVLVFNCIKKEKDSNTVSISSEGSSTHSRKDSNTVSTSSEGSSSHSRKGCGDLISGCDGSEPEKERMID